MRSRSRCSFSVTIAPGCSGCEGIGLLWTFLALYFWRRRADLRFPQAFLMIPVGTAVIWLAARLKRLWNSIVIRLWFGLWPGRSGGLVVNRIGSYSVLHVGHTVG